MGSEPLEEEIPVDRGSLTRDTQLVFMLYDKLQSKWEGMSGSYLGKDLSILPTLFDLYDIEDYEKKYCLDIIPIIDNYLAEDIADKIKQKTKSKPKG